MRRTVVLALAAALAIGVASPRRASACGQGGGSYGGLVAALIGGSIVIGGTDLFLTFWDLRSLAGAPPSAGYGVVETLLAAPQVALGIAGMHSNGSGFWTGYTIWMGALTAHGIWSMAAGARPTPPDPGASPVPVEPGSDPPASDVPQVQLRLGPTYVPLGPLAHPGFGLSIRF